MAQYFAPADPQDQTYNVLGSILGGLGNYAVHEYQKPERIKHFIDSGASEAEAKILVNMPVQQQSQWMQQKMKMQRDQEKNSILGSLMGGGTMQQTGIPGGDINQRLMSLGNPIQLNNQMQQPEQPATPLFNKQQEKEIVQKSKNMTPEQIDQVLRSGMFNLNEINQIKSIIDRERALEFKQQAHKENKELKQSAQEQKLEAPQRNQMVKEVAELEKAGRAAKGLISGFKHLKVAARDPNLRTGLWKQALDKFNLGEFGQSPISFVVDKMIGDINFASASTTTTPGKMTASILEQVARVNPSVFSQPEGIEAMADLKIYGAKVQEEVQKQIDKIRDKSPKGLLPLDTVSKAYKAAMPKIEKLHEKELKVVKRLSEVPTQAKQEIRVGSVVNEIPTGRRGKAIDRLTGKIIEF